MKERIVYLVLVESRDGVMDIDRAYERKGIAAARRLQLNAEGIAARVRPLTLVEEGV